VVKKVAAASRISTNEHLRSFALLEPFLAELVDLNPGTHYDVDVDVETQEFKGCALVMPYLKGGLENEILRPIFGLDVAHMKLIELEDSITLKPMFLSMISSRTCDNRMMICGFAITFSEERLHRQIFQTVPAHVAPKGSQVQGRHQGNQQFPREHLVSQGNVRKAYHTPALGVPKGLSQKRNCLSQA
jgi:hypothetical protein